MDPIKLLLADDQELIRESLHIVLDMDPDISVTAMAENGKAAVELCGQHSPDVVLMDIHMPVMDGVEATRIIKARWPDIRVIILTTFQDISYVVDALSAGAEGYLLKAIHPKELAAGIKWVRQGGTLIPPDIAGLLVRQLQSFGIDGAGSARRPEPGPPDGSGKADTYGLSDRELQVLHSLAEGLNNREIAARLFLSEGTVKNYISSIYSKLDVRDRIQAARKAQSEGMLGN